jgi:hypothetical protein
MYEVFLRRSISTSVVAEVKIEGIRSYIDGNAVFKDKKYIRTISQPIEL